MSGRRGTVWNGIKIQENEYFKSQSQSQIELSMKKIIFFNHTCLNSCKIWNDFKSTQNIINKFVYFWQLSRFVDKYDSIEKNIHLYLLLLLFLLLSFLFVYVNCCGTHWLFQAIGSGIIQNWSSKMKCQLPLFENLSNITYLPMKDWYLWKLHQFVGHML